MQNCKFKSAKHEILFSSQKFEISEVTNGGGQDQMFSHLTLLSDMRMEYEQMHVLEKFLSSSPEKPPGIDVVS